MGGGGDDIDPVLAAKAALRTSMKAARRAIPAAERHRRGRLVAGSLVGVSEVRAAGVVLAFCSFGTEVPTDGLIRLLWARDATVLVPVLRAGSIVPAHYREGDAVVQTTYGPLEPAIVRPADPGGIDVVVVPGLAFDRTGHRLGYGGGYYDRFLSHPAAHAFLVGVAFAEQIVADVPAGADDVRLQMIVTDEERIRPVVL